MLVAYLLACLPSCWPGVFVIQSFDIMKKNETKLVVDILKRDEHTQNVDNFFIFFLRTSVFNRTSRNKTTCEFSRKPICQAKQTYRYHRYRAMRHIYDHVPSPDRHLRADSSTKQDY